jgi:hypothetical protein
MEINGKNSRLERFTTEKRAPGISIVNGCVCPTAVLVAFERKKIFLSLPVIELRFL